MVATTNQSSIYRVLEENGNIPANPSWIQQPFRSIDRGTGGQAERQTDDTVTPDRQPLRGQTTAISASVNYSVGNSLSVFQQYASSLMFHKPEREAVQEIVATGAATVNDAYIVPALTDGSSGSDNQIKFLKAGVLINVKGSIHSANNGIKVLDADSRAGDTTLGVSENLTDETPANMSISVCGFRKPSGTSVSWDYNSTDRTGTLTWTNHGLAALGLEPGMEVHIGSPDGSGGYSNTMGTGKYGSMIVRQVTTNTVIFVSIPTELQSDTAAFTTALDLLFGVSYKFRGVLDIGYVRRNHRFLQLFNNIGANDTHQFQDIHSALLNNMNMEFQNNSLSSMSMSFLGEDVTPGLTQAVVTDANGAYKLTTDRISSPRNQLRFNVSTNVTRMEIVDEDTGADLGYKGFFRNWNFNISNNINPERSAQTLYNKVINPGQVTINYTGQVFFVSDKLIINSLNNTPTPVHQIVTNLEGLVSFYCPSMTFTTDTIYDVNNSMKLDLNGSADKQNTFNQAMFLNIIDVGELANNG